jgi:hypothetical protein
MPEVSAMKAGRVRLRSQHISTFVSPTSIKSPRNITNSTCTMKYTVLLLVTTIIGAVCGAELGAEIQGVTTSGTYCTEKEKQILYKECVEDVAVSMGVVLSRRLELRGNRDLQSFNHCSGCGSGTYPPWHWCFVMCSNRRRLTFVDEHVPSDRLLVSKGQIQQGANDCLDQKIEEGYECLGNPSDLRIKILLSD